MLSNVVDVISNRITPTDMEKPATMRMSTSVEAEMVKKFDDWKAIILSKNNLDS